MKRFKNIIFCLIGFVVVMAVQCALSQTVPDATSAASDVELKKDKSAPTPDLGPSTFFGGSFGGHWAFTTETDFSQEYDDNVFSSDLIRLSDNLSRFSERVSAAVQKKQLRVQIHYMPSYVYYSKYSAKNAWTQQYSQEVTYRWSAHTDLSWTLFASRTPSGTITPFQFVNFSGLFLPVFHPEALETNATILNANTAVGWSHRFSARNSVSVQLQSNVVKFQQANNVPLSPFNAQKSFSSSGEVKFESEIIPHSKVGIEVSDAYFGFLDPASHSHYQFVKGRFSRAFFNGLQVTVGAGPSRTEKQLIPGLATIVREEVGYSMDASVTKSAQRHSFGATYSHGSQLGLVQGSLGSDTVSVFAMRKFGRRWSANGGFSYGRSASQNAVQLATTNSYSTNALVGYQLLNDLSLTANYSYVNQAATLVPVPVVGGGLGFDRNIFSLGLRYIFQLNAGR